MVRTTLRMVRIIIVIRRTATMIHTIRYRGITSGIYFALSGR